MDELNCILWGGNDYVTKPYPLPILLARISAVLRRTLRPEEKSSPRMEHKGVTLDVAAGRLWKISLLIFFSVYLLYFLATYVGFKRNIRG